MRKTWCIAAAIALASTAHANAGEQSFTISCAASLQPSFDAAVAKMASDPGEAHKMFHALAEKDRYCAAFHWGLAKTVSDPAKSQEHRRDAYLAAAESDASALEWQKLSELPQ